MIEAPNAERLCSPQDGFKKTILSRGEEYMKKCSLIIILLMLAVGFVSVDAKATDDNSNIC